MFGVYCEKSRSEQMSSVLQYYYYIIVSKTHDTWTSIMYVTVARLLFFIKSNNSFIVLNDRKNILIKFIRRLKNSPKYRWRSRKICASCAFWSYIQYFIANQKSEIYRWNRLRSQNIRSLETTLVHQLYFSEGVTEHEVVIARETTFIFVTLFISAIVNLLSIDHCLLQEDK